MIRILILLIRILLPVVVVVVLLLLLLIIILILTKTIILVILPQDGLSQTCASLPWLHHVLFLQGQKPMLRKRLL